MTRTFAAYRDVQIVLDTALEQDAFPLEYRLATKGEAVNWRMRANRYRADLRRYDKKIHGKPVGESKYDELVFQLDNNVVIINRLAPTGQLTINGKPIEPIVTPDDEDDDGFSLGDLE